MLPDASSAVLTPELETWAQTLPRLLWELGASQYKHVDAILNVCATLGARRLRCATAPDTCILDMLEQRLTLLFYAVSKGRPLFGPFIEVGAYS